MFILLFGRLKSCCIFARHKKNTISVVVLWKEHSNPQEEREETSTVSENVWPRLMVEKYWQLEEQRAERKYLFHQNHATKNDSDFILF